MNDIRTAQYQAKLLYNVDLKDDDFEELALIALQRIGNKHTQLQKIKEVIQMANNNYAAKATAQITIVDTTDASYLSGGL